MNIRQARLNDEKEVLRLVKNIYGKSSPKSVKNWERNYKRFIRLTFVFEKNKKIAGYIYYGAEKNALYIGDLYVLPKFRNQKIATKLIAKIDKIKKRLKKKYLRVDARKKDRPAMNLYNKLGFKVWKLKNKNSLKLRR